MTTTLSHINYSFTTAGISPVLVERHATFVRDRLATLFGLKASDVKATSKLRLPEGVPFTLTCYCSRSESDAASMARAAKYVLPHLEDMRKMTADALVAVAGWEPGAVQTLDLEAVGLIGDGLADTLEPDQRAWLERKAVETGAVDCAGGIPNQNLAVLVFPKLAAVPKAPAPKAKQPPRDLSMYDYQLVRIVDKNGKASTISMNRGSYLRLVRASRMNLDKLNKYIRSVALELLEQPLKASLSKAVRDEVLSRLTAGAA